MKNKIKKIVTTSLLSAVAFSAIGCSSTTNKVAKNIDKSMAEFVSSINKLDYVDTSSEQTNKIGKIVETSNTTNFLNENASTLDIDNTITRPSERTDNFKLFVLSNKPYISLTSNDNSTSLDISLKFSTDQIEETSDEINDNINNLILKRSILMIYVNEIYNGNITLSEENKTAINAYVNVIKENASFLNGNRGMVKNQLGLASDLYESNKNDNLVNYYIIKSGEALETRSNKINSTISAIDSIINILESNLSPTSAYYNSKLSTTYQNILTNINSNNSLATSNSADAEIANKIAESLRFKTKLTNSNSNIALKNNSNTQKQTTNQVRNQQTNNQSNNISHSTISNNNINNLQTNPQINSTENLSNRSVTNNEQSSNRNQTTDELSSNTKIIRDTSRRHNRIRRKNQINNQRNNFNTDYNNEVKTLEENSTNQTNQSVNHSRLSTNEEYSRTSNSNTQNNRSRATRVPYQTTSTFNEQ